MGHVALFFVRSKVALWHFEKILYMYNSSSWRRFLSNPQVWRLHYFYLCNLGIQDRLIRSFLTLYAYINAILHEKNRFSPFDCSFCFVITRMSEFLNLDPFFLDSMESMVAPYIVIWSQPDAHSKETLQTIVFIQSHVISSSIF